MATYTVKFWELTLFGEKGAELGELSGDFETELDAIEDLNVEFRETYSGNFISEIHVG